MRPVGLIIRLLGSLDSGVLMKYILFSISFLIILSGCSSAGVIYSSDPNVKMDQAIELKKLGRPIPAGKLMKEALVLFDNESNYEGARFATFQLAMLYESEGKFDKACASYDESNRYHEASIAIAPTKNYYVLDPYNDWNEMVVASKNKIGC